ncbi:MAG TPA: hypothetical protein VN154_05500, partial [Rhizomicrobium sp.]|nr:hypothetical protein [Rhizomicrobium sp.]
IGVYAYDCMELNDAGQVAAQAIWARCEAKQLVPAAESCSGYQIAANSVAHGTPLGTNAQISFGGYFASSTVVSSMTTPGEGFACLNSSGVLTSTTDQPPTADEATASKDGISNSSCSAHDYILLQATMQNFSSIFPFPSLSLVTSLPTPQRLVLMRLD